MKRLPGLDYQEITKELADLQLPTYRHKQIVEAIYQQKCCDFQAISVLPAQLRYQLSQSYNLGPLPIIQKQVSPGDGAEKRLLQLDDQESVEVVFLRQRHGNSVCVSTQVGCKMGCLLCASGKNGFGRHLTAQEMFLQVWSFWSDPNYGRINDILLMGSGEPLDNLDNCLRFYSLFIDSQGMQQSKRNFVISTCGLVPQMRQLARMRTKITLAVSLHSAIDEMRNLLVPINRKYNIGVLIEACQDYFIQTKRRVTLEYALIKGKNDGPQDLLALRNLLQGKRGLHLNLIPANPIQGSSLAPSDEVVIRSFHDTISKAGVAVSVRNSQGCDIAAACGQLKGI